MKPFDFEKANQGAEVCTRDGRNARIICFDRKGSYPIVALIEAGDSEETRHYDINGCYHPNGSTDGLDLMLVTKKQEGWVAVLRNDFTGTIKTYGCVYDTKEEALEVGKEMGGFIGVSKIEWED